MVGGPWVEIRRQRMNRSARLLALSMAVVSLVCLGTGCAKKAPPASPSTPASGAKTTPASPAKSTAPGAPIKVGAIFAVTGPAANLGAPEAKTAEMCVERLNNAGGINGRKIQLLVKD